MRLAHEETFGPVALFGGAKDSGIGPDDPHPATIVHVTRRAFFWLGLAAAFH